MRILFFGDIIGRPGRKAVVEALPRLIEAHAPDFILANAENIAAGKGLNQKLAEELLHAGVDLLTTGNHVWAQKEIFPYLAKDPPVLRPLNYSRKTPGKGWMVLRKGDKALAVINVAGRVFMGPANCPFEAIDEVLEPLHQETPFIFVDFHGEATSEKQSAGWYFDGKVSAIVGTHTHVQTADERILPGGTAFISDVGMCGPENSIIGNEVESVLPRMITGLPSRFEVAKGPVILQAALITFDDATGLAKSILRIQDRT